ncbi:hypothetical protein TNCV_3658321 [Trichonephila clavipes]|nr:hypothetical protein TNCV_3658321 [Trichonephila clavipes]
MAITLRYPQPIVSVDEDSTRIILSGESRFITEKNTVSSGGVHDCCFLHNNWSIQLDVVKGIHTIASRSERLVSATCR